MDSSDDEYYWEKISLKLNNEYLSEIWCDLYFMFSFESVNELLFFPWSAIYNIITKNTWFGSDNVHFGYRKSSLDELFYAKF